MHAPVRARLIGLFGVRSVDRGRPLSEPPLSLGDISLETDAARARDRLAAVGREVRTGGRRCCLFRVLSSRVTGDRIDGVVITLIDLTGGTKPEERMELVMQELDHRVRLCSPSSTPS